MPGLLVIEADADQLRADGINRTIDALEASLRRWSTAKPFD